MKTVADREREQIQVLYVNKRFTLFNMYLFISLSFLLKLSPFPSTERREDL